MNDNPRMACIAIACWKNAVAPSAKDLEDFSNLLAQLTHEDDVAMPTVTEPSFFYHMCFAEHTLIIARDRKTERIIGMASVHFKHLMKEGTVADVEEVVVDKAYRGQGVADLLDNAIERTARERGVLSVRLTSAPWREAANKFYARRGYKRYETNNYRKTLRS